MSGNRRSLVGALAAVGGRVLVALFVLNYLVPSLAIGALLVATAAAVVAAALAAVRALLVRWRGW